MNSILKTAHNFLLTQRWLLVFMSTQRSGGRTNDVLK